MDRALPSFRASIAEYHRQQRSCSRPGGQEIPAQFRLSGTSTRASWMTRFHGRQKGCRTPKR